MTAIESTAVALGQGRKRILTARHAGQARVCTVSLNLDGIGDQMRVLLGIATGEPFADLCIDLICERR